MKTVYVETSILSYLTARPSRDLLAAARQMITRDWWDGQRARFEVFISPLVEQEARRGDAEAAQRRGDSLRGLAVLEVVEAAYDLAAALITERALHPPQPKTTPRTSPWLRCTAIDYLLTWNCRHLDNAETKPIVRSICAMRGYTCPEICTPEELMGEEHEC